MIYPIFLLVLAAAVIAIVLGVAMPAFAEMFESLGTELPAITRFLMAASDFVSKKWFILVGVLMLLVVAYRMWVRTEQGRMQSAKLQLRLPILGKVAQMNAAYQMAVTLATLLSSGLSLIRAITLTARALDNYYLGQSLATVLPKLESGRRLGECLKELGVFPSLLVEMAVIGEESGYLDGTLETMGELYADEAKLAAEKAMAAMQPAITIVLGVVIGFIVIALYLPMFTMYAHL